jgi:transposase
MGEEVSRRLAHRPEAFFWKEQVRVKYVCPGCAKITRPVLPPAPIEKSLADTSLLADLLLSKYCDHLPLSRLEAIYSRSGVELSKSTLGSWIGAVTDDALLGAIAEAVGKDVCSRSLAQTDETGILVLDRQHPEGRFNGRMWVFCGRTGELFYEYTPTKETKYPQARLADFRGILVADAYPGFDGLFKDGSIREAGCNAHARRKFKDAHEAEPSRDEPRWALLFYSRIFKIEREAKEKGLDAEARLALRQEKSAPIVKAFYSWLKQLKERLVPSDPLRRAVVYALNQEEALSLFLQDGRLEIHNNRSELSLRQVAVGRKNWLFAGSPAGAKSAAVAYTLIMSCKELGLPVREYLIDVLDRVSTHPMSRIDELTPRGWKAAREGTH